MLLKKPRSGTEFHPVAAATTKFCMQQIQEHGGKIKTLILEQTSIKLL